VSLKKLNSALMLLRGGKGFEGAKISSSAGFGIHLAGVEAILA
jgi:hypothetical protein